MADLEGEEDLSPFGSYCLPLEEAPFLCSLAESSSARLRWPKGLDVKEMN